MAGNEDFLGVGIEFPYKIDNLGKITLERGRDLIQQSLEKLFKTTKRTDFFREHFGSDVERALFEPNDVIAQSLLDFFVADAIQKWEKRVRLIEVTFNKPDDKRVDLTVVVQIKQSNEIEAFIFPFYRELKD